MSSDPMSEHREAVKRGIVEGGAPAVISYVEGFEEEPLRRVLYLITWQVVGRGDWPGKSWDAVIEVCDAGVAEIERQAEAAASAGDDETRGQCLHGAHIISYNLAAELADCWPWESPERSRSHFERGLKAAEDCLSWSEPAGSPGPISGDFWVKGMHQLSLGRVDAAVQSWERSLEFAVADAQASGKPAAVSAQGAFGVILGSGYLGLGRWIDGDEAGRGQFDEAMAAFSAQLDDEEKAGEAKLGREQLETVRDRYGP